MIVPLFPPLDGEAAERFHAFATDLADLQREGDKGEMANVLDREVAWCRSASHLGKKAVAYEACVRENVALWSGPRVTWTNRNPLRGCLRHWLKASPFISGWCGGWLCVERWLPLAVVRCDKVRPGAIAGWPRRRKSAIVAI